MYATSGNLCITFALDIFRDSRLAVTTLAKGLETFSLQVLSDFEEAFSEWGIFDYTTACALMRHYRREDGAEDGRLMVRVLVR